MFSLPQSDLIRTAQLTEIAAENGSHAGTLSQSIKPALRGIEGRLAQLLQVAMQRGR